MLRRAPTILWAAYALAFALPAQAGLVPPQRSYHARDMFDIGYKSTQQPDGTWRIKMKGRPIDGPEFAVEAAYYRAAELADEAGKRFFQIVDFDGMQVLRGRTVGQGMVTLVVLLADGDATPAYCKARNAEDCRTFDAAAIMARLGPTLVFRPAKPATK